jgi:alpha-mannosidase
MHKDEKFVEARIKRFLTHKLPEALYLRRHDLTLNAWVVPDEPVSFSEAVQQRYSPISPGDRWGKPWGTTWLRVQGIVPSDWKLVKQVQLELEVDLGFSQAQPGFQAEALVWTKDGQVIKGLEPRNRAVKLNLQAGDEIFLYLEAASNPDVARDWTYQPTDIGDKASSGNDLQYQIKRVQVALLDLNVWNLIQDFEVLFGLLQQLSESEPRRYEILRGLERAIDGLDPDSISSGAVAARTVLAPLLASPAHASAHSIHAVGHAHIDSAWLWPIRETRRKVARTFSNALTLIDQSPDFIFVASSAQQYQWIKEDYPDLFARIRKAVKGGQFVPTGGMWVESDSNIPSGESLTRQLLEGKRFFMEEFGIEPVDIWLPDSFGYSGSLPQIAKHAGSKWFLMQKISWNDTNVFPHHTFLWEGIDGTQVFTHFPPADTYNSAISAAELHRAESRFAERGFTNTSLLPFGWGDGGGGPTREMVASGERTHNLEGSPRVEFSSPSKFFQIAESEYSNPPVWVGELYLEFHRAASITQAAIKLGNRLGERLMREVELWWTTAAVQKNATYPAQAIRSLWQKFLLLQFHDILPGTSITWVHQEAIQMHQEIRDSAEALIHEAAILCLGTGDQSVQLNSGPFSLRGISPLSAGQPQVSTPARISKSRSQTLLENRNLHIAFNSDGHITSILDKKANREVVPQGLLANLLQLHVDTPSVWDAWDIDRSYKHMVTDINQVENLETLELSDKSIFRVSRKFGSSSVIQEVCLRNEDDAIEINVEVDWEESEKLLKLAFPFEVQTLNATSEIQYGHLSRPIHSNTSWDAARFETVAHRWVYIGEPDYGIALANSSSYGYDITRGRREGKNYTNLRVSILRAPKFPDPDSDRGKHSFSFLLRVGANIATAIKTGYELNVPLREVSGVAIGISTALFEISSRSVIAESIKLADDGSGDVVVRLYESQGIRSGLMMQTNFNSKRAWLTDALEREIAAEIDFRAGVIRADFTPFQLSTFRISRAT